MSDRQTQSDQSVDQSSGQAHLQPSASIRDIASVVAADWPQMDYPLAARPSDTPVPVIIKRSVLDEIAEHGRSTQDVEVCGVMVGSLYFDVAGPFLYVEAIIKGDHASGQAAQVTFTADTWTHVQEVMERDFVGLRVIGWYHTHPGYGIFLSEMDVFIHENFFDFPWQIAFVFDPKANEDGLFCWRDGKLQRQSYEVQEDVAGREATQPSSRPALSGGVGEPPGTVLELSNRIRRLEKLVRTMTAALALVAVIAIVWPLAVFIMIPGRNSEVPGHLVGPSPDKTIPIARISAVAPEGSIEYGKPPTTWPAQAEPVESP
jgi:proteasome lid subunit RPN8/RPN11